MPAGGHVELMSLEMTLILLSKTTMATMQKDCRPNTSETMMVHVVHTTGSGRVFKHWKCWN